LSNARGFLRGLFVVLLLAGLASPAFAASPSQMPLPAPGDRSSAVVRLQAALDDWGADLPWSGYFGRATEAALRATGPAAGVPYDGGPVSQALWDALGLGGPTPLLQPGTRGASVAALQRALTRGGYGVAATGLLGPMTDNLVRHLQVALHQPTTGIVRLSTVEQWLAQSPVESVVGLAADLVGDPYSWGGAGPRAFDCSGLIAYVFRHVGMDLPHSSYAQFSVGQAVPASHLRPGDLVFFDTWGGGPSHVGLYVGDGMMIDAGDYQTGVEYTALNAPGFAGRYIGARQVT
jgi:peptidoglycan hydrolase-like protein with peptidoglycan-binding domain